MIRRVERREGITDTVVEVSGVRFGRDPLPVVAGPCTIESAEQLLAVAERVADSGAVMLRGNTVAADVSPYAFRGLGEEGVVMLEEAGSAVGLPTLTQVAEAAHVEATAGRVDMLEIGAGSMQDFELLREVGRSGKPVMLKRGPSATVDEWLWAAEYILAEGNSQVVMCERGIRAFGDSDTLDIGSVPVVRERSHLPVVVFPSHAAGERSRVAPLALAAQGVGADGLIIEVHPDPAAAMSNPTQQLDPDGFAALMASLGVNRMRNAVDLVDRDIVRLLARRRRLTRAIGIVKAERGLPVQIPEREGELLDVIGEEAQMQGLDDAYVKGLFEAILENSRAAQRREREQS